MARAKPGESKSKAIVLVVKLLLLRAQWCSQKINERDSLSLSRHTQQNKDVETWWDDPPACFSKQGALVFAKTHFVRIIVRFAYVIVKTSLTFC